MSPLSGRATQGDLGDEKRFSRATSQGGTGVNNHKFGRFPALIKTIIPEPPQGMILEQICARMVKQVLFHAESNNSLLSVNRCIIRLSPIDLDAIWNAMQNFNLEMTLTRYLNQQIRIMYLNGGMVYLPLQMRVNFAEFSWLNYWYTGSPHIELINTIPDDLRKFSERHGHACLQSTRLGISQDLDCPITVIGRGETGGAGRRIVIPAEGRFEHISRQHAYIEFTGEGYYLVRLPKTQGVFLDDDSRTIPFLTPVPLTETRIIRVGKNDPKNGYQQVTFKFTFE